VEFSNARREVAIEQVLESASASRSVISFLFYGEFDDGASMREDAARYGVLLMAG
jgi:hypothetical protein